MSDAFATLNDAVYQAALATREKYGNEHEAVSLVYEQGGKFYFTEPVNDKKRSSQVSGTIQIPKGSLRLIVHNHPEGKDNAHFSEDDVAMAEKLKIPSAIIFGAENPSIRIYTPGVTKTYGAQLRGQRTKVKRSAGDEFAGTMQ